MALQFWNAITETTETVVSVIVTLLTKKHWCWRLTSIHAHTGVINWLVSERSPEQFLLLYETSGIIRSQHWGVINRELIVFENLSFMELCGALATEMGTKTTYQARKRYLFE